MSLSRDIAFSRTFRLLHTIGDFSGGWSIAVTRKLLVRGLDCGVRIKPVLVPVIKIAPARTLRRPRLLPQPPSDGRHKPHGSNWSDGMPSGQTVTQLKYPAPAAPLGPDIRPWVSARAASISSNLTLFQSRKIFVMRSVCRL